MKVKKGELMLGTYFLLITAPYYFSNIVFRLGLIIFSCIISATLVRKKYRPSAMVYAIGAYFLYLIILSFIKNTDNANFSFIYDCTKYLICIAAIEFKMKESAIRTNKILFCVLGFYIALDFLSVVFFPNGLYNSEVIYRGEGIGWSYAISSYVPGWIYGNKNNHAPQCTLLILLSFCEYAVRKGRKKSIVTDVITLGIIIMMAVISSSTSFVNILLVWAVLLLSRYKGNKRVKVKGFTWYAVYLAVSISVVFGLTSFLEPVVKTLFNKDLTFSGRTTVWAQMPLLIMKNFPWGSGSISYNGTAEILNNPMLGSAHNQLLSDLWQGGLVIVVIEFIIFSLIGKKLGKLHNPKLSLVASGILLGIYIEMIFEVYLTTMFPFTWMLIEFLYNLDVYENEVYRNEYLDTRSR